MKISKSNVVVFLIVAVLCLVLGVFIGSTFEKDTEPNKCNVQEANANLVAELKAQVALNEIVSNTTSDDNAGASQSTDGDNQISKELGIQLGNAAKKGEDFIKDPDTQAKIESAAQAVKEEGQSFIDGFLEGYNK